jgi:hypothetical protein
MYSRGINWLENGKKSNELKNKPIMGENWPLHFKNEPTSLENEPIPRKMSQFQCVASRLDYRRNYK